MTSSKRQRGIVYGVGINDYRGTVQKFEGSKLVWICPYYARWKAMLSRCYGNGHNTTLKMNYSQTSVCDEWLQFTVFREWMIQQELLNPSVTHKSWHLDKDIIGWSVNMYSPDACAFVPDHVNTFFLDSQRSRGIYLLGVDLHKGKYRARCTVNKVNKHLGYYGTEYEAHLAWCEKKREELVKLITGNRVGIRVLKGLLFRLHVIDSSVSLGKPVVSLHKPWGYLGVADEFTVDEDTWEVLLAEQEDVSF